MGRVCLGAFAKTRSGGQQLAKLLGAFAKAYSYPRLAVGVAMTGIVDGRTYWYGFAKAGTAGGFARPEGWWRGIATGRGGFAKVAGDSDWAGQFRESGG